MIAGTGRPLIASSEFLFDAGVVHLCAGGEAPILGRTLAAFAKYAHDKGSGVEGRLRMEAKLAEARAALARLLDLPEHDDQIAFTSSASHALSAIAGSLDWASGDNVVALADEFPSCLLAWTHLKRIGVDLHLVDPGGDPEGALLAAADERTRLICVSHVSFRHGLRIDLHRLADGLRTSPTALVADVSHSIGVIEIPADCCDALVACGHKFLLGTHGTGILIQRGEKLGSLLTAPLGWFSVRNYDILDGEAVFVTRAGAGRFETGNPNFPALYALTEGLSVLNRIGASNVERHAMELSGELRRGLATLGLSVWTPQVDARRGSSIAVRTSRGEEIARQLATENILIIAGEGRIRISLHAYNSAGDVDVLLNRISSII